MDTTYNPQEIELAAQAYWEKKQTFKVTEDLNKEKFYCLSMFPYPSGKLHMGHVRNYTIGDVIARHQRMLGKNVLQPIGWDAFGLPAENAAIQNQLPPAEWTYSNIDHMRRQLKSLGFGYDWSREIATCDPNYYRWEQWLFTRLYTKGLVYRKSAIVNWDPVDNTVLANEQVIDGRGWRSGALIERREIPQWFLKITEYADELLANLDTLTGWPEQVTTMQRNWIGRSEGVELQFAVEGAPAEFSHVTIFTTRPDTVMGVTYLAIAPEHPLAKYVGSKQTAVQNFIQQCQNTKTAEAELATQQKKGIDTGLKARHPLTKELVPIWIANFVVMDYGSGALMAVPAHDERDFEFAQSYGLEIKQVIQPPNAETKIDLSQAAFVEHGKLINAGTYTGLTSEQACHAIIEDAVAQGIGQRKINYRLRDWSISRQRYWGTPIPIIYCDHCGTVPVPENDLPVVLPEQVEFTGNASPLKNMPSFYKVNCPQCSKAARRETDTFDTFIESAWYYARYTCKDQQNAMLDDRARYWTPVDYYIGGIEHAVLHLLYARFFHKLIRDEGLVNSDEPFSTLLTQGMVLKDGSKMSKSKGNTVDPQTMIENFGADTVRLFMMFASPPEQSLEWSDSGVEGAHRFLKRLWSFAYHCSADIKAINAEIKSSTHNDVIQWVEAPAEIRKLRQQIHAILKQAHHDYERAQFNTVVSAGMKLLNLLVKLPEEHAHDFYEMQLCHEGLSILLRLLAPIVPHITHYLWRELEFGPSIVDASWPRVDSHALKVESIKLVIQVNGKWRGELEVPASADQAQVEQLITQHPETRKWLQGKSLRKTILVPGRLINLVAGD